MGDRPPKRRLHSNVKREWRSHRRRNMIQNVFQSASIVDTFETTNTSEEETSFHRDHESMADYYVNQRSSSCSVSSETEKEEESDFEHFGSNTNVNYDSHRDADEDDDIEDFISKIINEDQNKSTPLYDGSPISVHEACVHLIQLSNSLNLNKNRLQILLKELRFFFPSECRLPKTVFTLFKLTDNDDHPQVSTHCVECSEILIKLDQKKCSNACSLNGKYRSYSQIAELAIMNVENEIKRVAKRYIHLINEYPKQAVHLCPSDHINGNIYHQLPSNQNHHNITIILHSDGAPVIDVTNKSVWSVQATIAEIPPQPKRSRFGCPPLRDSKSAVMLFGAWLAATKPPRDCLLAPIVIQLETLMKSGINLKQNDGSTWSYNLRIQQAIFDLPARAHSLNVVQYNGYDGCADCCIKDEYLFRYQYCFITFVFLGVAIGRQVYFPFSKKREKPKDHQFYLKNAKLASDKKQLLGVDRLFSLYCESLSTLYSKRSELATIHYHCHLLSQVHYHGALCFTSCFARESYLSHVLNWCKGTRYVLSQLVTWYNISQNVHKSNSISLPDIFSKESFSPTYVDNNFIASIQRDFLERLQPFSVSSSDCTFFSRYFRGFLVFQKKNKHSIIAKHQVTIDTIDEQNGTVRSSGFVQPVRIIAEGSCVKCRERASQFSRDTGSEEVDVSHGNDDEDELVDENHIYTTQNFCDNGNNQHSPSTTNAQQMSDVIESALDFRVVTGYKHIGNTTICLASERDHAMSGDAGYKTQTSQNKNDIEKETVFSNTLSPRPLLIDEHAIVQEINQENSNIVSNARDEASDSCEQEDDELPLQNKSTKKNEKERCDLEFANLFFYNKNLSNIINQLPASRSPPPPEPEFVLGVDISNFSYGFDEHTRLVRQIFRTAGYTSNPNAVLNDEEKVNELKNLMKKRDKTLRNDENLLTDAWQTVKESVRQLKHDDKRNKLFKTIRTSNININNNNTNDISTSP
ncbi:unnamed protein product [Rotaria socialis]|uniref:Uncharacterized protein n=2 Tax=Rotaria socialis TaxID=392032 RepID=A0A817SRQ0_9BILA|nr:unnamed protein product [Rotaria socialis]